MENQGDHDRAKFKKAKTGDYRKPTFPSQFELKKLNIRCFFNPMNIFRTFYRNQVSLGSDLLVRLSLTHSATFC